MSSTAVKAVGKVTVVGFSRLGANAAIMLVKVVGPPEYGLGAQANDPQLPQNPVGRLLGVDADDQQPCAPKSAIVTVLERVTNCSVHISGRREYGVRKCA